MDDNRATVKVIAILLGLSFFLGEGLNYSQLGPFFPTEAMDNKGVSTTFIGVITGAFDVANFIAAFALASFITPQNQKFFFCTGALLSATCSGLFGIMGYSVGGTPFIVVCTLVRTLMGVGASMVWSTGVPLLVPIYPQWSGRITSLIETSIGLGSMIGPSVGSALYSLGGYTTPFLVAASVQIFFAFMSIIFLPNKASQHDNPSKTIPDQPLGEVEKELPGFTFVFYATRPSVLAVCFPMICHAASMGLLDVALAPYLKDNFDVGGNTSGYYFLAYSAVYASLSPFLGLLIDRGHAGRIFLVSCYIGAVSYLMLWLPNVEPSLASKVWIICWLAVLGLANASGFTSVYLIFEKLAYTIGFRVENNVKLMTAALLNACFAVGRMLGPIIIGGVFMDAYGYYYSFLFQSCLLFLSGLFSIYSLMRYKMLHRIYYPQEGDSEHLAVKYEGAIESLAFESGVSKRRDTAMSGLTERSSVAFVIHSGRYNPILSIKSDHI